MNKALIIIDMQPYYDDNGTVSEIITKCQREINKAIEENIKIVLVEWEGAGSTDKRLRELVEEYQNLSVVFKNNDDGSHQIIDEIGKSYNLFRVCGVNTDACVMATVRGLVGLCYNLNIEIVADAVNTCWPDQQFASLSKLKAFPRTKVVY